MKDMYFVCLRSTHQQAITGVVPINSIQLKHQSYVVNRLTREAFITWPDEHCT